MNIPKNPFILVDGSSYLFRAYHALPPLTTAKGQPTGAIFGVANMLRKLIKDYQPENIAVVFDSKEKNFRHALYEPYKANRLVMPEELQSQIEPLYELIRAMGLPLIMMPGYEADDIIGSLAKYAKEHGLFTLISTGDKDFAQLVCDHIILINTMSQTIYDREKVIEKFEVPPEKMVDYLALIGDNVDNIPGVAKVGPKTAVKWLQSHENLETIVEKAGEIPGKVGENLREAIPLLPLFKQLVTIDVNLALEFHPKDLKITSEDREKLKQLFINLEFKSWLRELEAKQEERLEEKPEAKQEKNQKVNVEQNLISEQNTTAQIQIKNQAQVQIQDQTQVQYELILTTKQLDDWLKKLMAVDMLAINLHVSSPDYMTTNLLGIGFSIGDQQTCYIPFALEASELDTNSLELMPNQYLNKTLVLSKLKPILEDKHKLKIGHNLKFDMEVLAKSNIHLEGLHYDVMLESYLLDAAGARHDIHSLAERYLDLPLPLLEDITGKGKKFIPLHQIDINIILNFVALKADAIFRLHQILWPKIAALPSVEKLYLTIEMPLIQVLARMERLGVLVSGKELQKQSAELLQRLTRLEQEAITLAGESFNLNSPKQLQEILFNRLKLPVIEKTPTGQPSTGESVLQELAENYPLPKIILEYRTLIKLKTTYTDKLPEQIDPTTGRVHTYYHQAVTSTGRLSSSQPNLQNIPIRTQEGRKIRASFVASPGYKIVAADYSQIELRIMAHLSRDPGLVKAFNMGDDIHRSTAEAVYNVPLNEVTSEQRRNAKIINFGLLYGMSHFGLAKQLGLKREEAEKQIERYFSCFPGVRSFIDSVLNQARTEGFVETLFGRRLYLPDLQSRNMMVRKAAERAAINAPMQGTNADIVKLAMIELDRYAQQLNQSGPEPPGQSQDKFRMIMQVHDELVFEIAEDILNEACEKIKSVMENIIDLSVKLHVDIGIGNNWDEAHQ